MYVKPSPPPCPTNPNPSMLKERHCGTNGGQPRDPAHLEAGHGAVPGRKALRVLRRHARRCAICATENDGAGDGARAHVVVLGRGVDYLVDGLHGEVEGHELHNGAQALEGGAHADTRESRLQARWGRHGVAMRNGIGGGSSGTHQRSFVLSALWRPP